MSIGRKMFYSWGTMLGLIPFVILLIYGAIVVHSNARGAAKHSVAAWIGREVALTVIAGVVIIGIAYFVARRIVGGGGR